MVSEPLITYLNDHLGGAQIAVEALNAMRVHHDDQRFRQFAEMLLPEVQADDETLQSIADRIGSHSSAAKKAGGWLLERLARMKLGHAGSTDFAMFESLELLVLGIHGKECLWKALRAASELDARLRSYDFEALIQRARSQYEKVENERLNLARTVL